MGIQIEVYNRSGSYVAGEVVDGKVIVRNERPEKIKQVTILLEGKGRVNFSGKEIRVAKEKYVSLLSILAGDEANSIMLPEGTISFPFHIILPPNLPSSFDSQIGRVSYVLKGEVKKSSPLKMNDRTKLPILVSGIFDLNLEPSATVRNKCERSKGKLNFVLTLPTRSGFVPGEAMDFKVDITNGTNKKITWMSVSLQQVARFWARGHSKKKKSHVCWIHGPNVEKREHRIWEDTLSIPVIPPTSLGSNCKIIDLQYFLYLQIDMSGEISSLATAKLPVVIGTIPLGSTVGIFQSIPQSMPVSPVEPLSSNSRDAVILQSRTVLPDYPDLPPPSYAEAVGSGGLY